MPIHTRFLQKKIKSFTEESTHSYAVAAVSHLYEYRDTATAADSWSLPPHPIPLPPEAPVPPRGYDSGAASDGGG